MWWLHYSSRIKHGAACYPLIIGWFWHSDVSLGNIDSSSNHNLAVEASERTLKRFSSSWSNLVLFIALYGWVLYLKVLIMHSTTLDQISLFIGHYIRVTGQNLTIRFLLPLSIQLAVSVLAGMMLPTFSSLGLIRASIPPSLLYSLTCNAQY